MPICVLKRGVLCDRMSSRENESRYLHQNDVHLRDREKMATNLYLFRMHLHRQPNANTKLDLWSPIVDRDKSAGVLLRMLRYLIFCCR